MYMNTYIKKTSCLPSHYTTQVKKSGYFIVAYISTGEMIWCLLLAFYQLKGKIVLCTQLYCIAFLLNTRAKVNSYTLI